jgi:phosphoglycerate dehydrogenase-like enzyme
MGTESRRPKVLICDQIADTGIEMLQEHADVDVKTGLTPEELIATIGDYEGVVVRSATKIRANIDATICVPDQYSPRDSG